MATLAVKSLAKRYAGNAGVEDVSFSIESGQFLTLLGPSGCGKTTTLRMVAGLVAPDGGRILIGGRDVTAQHASRRNIGMVFQNLALFPHMTVAQNVGFGLKMRSLTRAEAAPRVARALEMVRLDGSAGKYPAQMSGGQQQRAALARALVIEPSLLVLDEPFAALDRKLRESMQTELRRLVKDLGITALFVTHDQEEALTLSDRVAVMSQGRIEQFGTPAEIFGAPRTRFVADFMGAANILPARILARDGQAVTLVVAGMTFRIPSSEAAPGRSAIEVAVRPERIGVGRAPAPDGEGAAAEIVEATFHGSAFRYVAKLDDGSRLEAREAADYGREARGLALGDRVWLSWPREAMQILSASDPHDPGPAGTG